MTVPTVPDTTPGGTRGGRVRLLPANASQAAAIRHAATAAPLAPDGLLRPDAEGARRENCASFRVTGSAAYADGRPVDAAAVIEAWETELRRPRSRAVWLLAPVRGAEAVSRGEALHAGGLEVDGQGRLSICTESQTPDWPARLAHPDLWLRGSGDSAERSGGPGPFEPGGEPDLLTASPTAGDGKPLLDEVVLTQPGESSPALLFDLEAVDLAIVSGREAGPLLDGAAGKLRVERLPEWDAVYALWFGARARWVSDPRFRAWVAGAVDREAMLRFLFDGRGEPAFRLTGAGGPEWRDPPSRPFSQGSVPRLGLIFDAADPFSTSIASRLKAVLEQKGLAIRLDPANGDRIRDALDDDELQMALIAHHAPVTDPVLALQHTLWDLGNPVGETWALLERGGWWSEEDRRLSAALFAEDTLLRPARLVPLVRLHAWLVSRPALQGVSAGPWGELRLDRAWWAR